MCTVSVSRLTLRALLTAALTFTFASSPAAKETSASVVPLRGIYYTADDLARAREALGREPWRQKLRDQITSAADVWAARDDQWIRDILPPPGSLFAYGRSGCPECGAAWKNFGASTCSFDRPGKVVCPECARVYPDPDPASPYHDTGRGVTVNGKRYYFVGIWNAFVVQNLYAWFGEPDCALSVLAHAYALTGREEYARKAIVIMDALATLSPTTRGPRDFDHTGQPDSDQGRLQHLTSIVYRAVADLARDYDLVGRHPLLAGDSPTSPGVTMAENIRRGLFEEYLFRHFDVRGGRLSTLHNHEADSVRAMLVVGLLFGNADYIRWGMDAFDQLVSNTIDRDGLYYETSTSYTRFTRSVLVDMAELIANYRPENYAGHPGDFPPARNPFDQPRLRALVVDNFDLSVAGHLMNFGNDHVDRTVITSPVGEWLERDWNTMARFAAYASDAAVRERVRSMLGSHLYKRRDKGEQSRWWLLKMGDPLPAPALAPVELTPVGSGRFFSTKGIAAFQSGAWPNRRGFLVRGGPGLPHAQDDLLGLNLWDVGRELAAELGYATYGSHLHKGWGSRALAHNLVVLDEDAPLSGTEYFKKSPGATFRSFYAQGPVRFMDADGRSQFDIRSEGVTRYRRRVVMVDADTSHSYYVDVFDVEGGSIRDYSLHAPYSDELLTNALTLEGIAPRPAEGAWTLAGLSPRWRSAEWNRPGRSWGERVTPGEYLRKLSPDDEVGPYGWTPPGRGYGFLYNLRTARTSAPWSATWKLDGPDGAHLRATFLPAGEQLACVANAPDLTGRHLFNWVVVRDSGTSISRFVVVLEPFRRERSVERVELVATRTTGPVVVKVTLKGGATDHVILNEPGAPAVEIDGPPALRAEAEFALVRADAAGRPAEAYMMRGSALDAGGRSLIRGWPSVRGGVAELTGKGELDRVIVTHHSQEGLNHLAQAPMALFSSYEHPQTTTIQITHDREFRGLGGGRSLLEVGPVALQQVRIDGVGADGLTSTSLPLPLAAVHEESTRFLHGKALIDAQGQVRGRIDRVLDFHRFLCRPGAQLKPGEILWVADMAPGDFVEFPLAYSWTAWDEARE